MTAATVAAAAPLAGTAVRAAGDTLPVRIAAARLRALGCAVETDGAWEGAGRIDLPGTGGAGCDIGWSADGADPADERDVQAACGLAHLHGLARGGPRFLPVDYASVCAGVLAAQAVAAVLLARERGGPALRASVSVSGAALLAVAPYAAEATADPDGAPVPGPGEPPPFRSADGVRFEIETLDPEAWLRFWELLGAPREAIAAGWAPFQRRFATAVCPLPAALSTVLEALPFAAAAEAARACGVGAVPLRTPEETAEEEPPSPWRLRGTGPAGALPPFTGPGPLSGLRVVEATNRVQGPLAGLLLTLLGADTVRVEPPGGDPMRGVPPLAGGLSARFAAFNRGKGAVECDLKTGRGRRAAADLAAAGDVFLYNWPPGRAERFGLGADDLAARAPGLVHVHADGWAGRDPAPDTPATDFLVQAHGGIAHLLADGGEPAPSLVTLTDVLGGLLAAEAALAGLLLRARAGTGAAARTALADAARLLRAAGRGTAHRPRPGTPAAADPAAAAEAFPEAFTRVHGTALPRAPWTFTEAEDHR
ncbi:CoA transferase [Nocardiopsis changdeensis]|uniref:CoA transferase n=1 Tax=Nocardiopsis changdeensis TaxID=2831969 RepID=A0ABX8BFE2_9ACTN|nr:MULTISPECIES: CoA transferase [Nocardiopsis]QUX20485.1 CoA transferase [Nocardiopsis changdeensis]QYX36416.1 CoA transferase [Nocardiopsis sp. MT53]